TDSCKITHEVVKRDGTVEQLYILFKNEADSRATETEPSGGGTACLGNAVLGTLSGRAYAFQTMRVTCGADATAPIEKTPNGKPSQREISRRAANAYSSYANQIGLPTGEAREYYLSGTAQRLETSFVVGATPQANVVREMPRSGDLVLLVGGSDDNATTASKLQRLMKSGEFTRLIKRCKACGAGGVAVTAGELSSGVDIELTSIPTTRAARSADELAISASGECVVIVIDAGDLDGVTELCRGENADVTVIAKITDNDRIRMFLNGNMIVDLERRFLDSNGVRRETAALIKERKANYFGFFSHKRAAMYAKGDYTSLMSNILSDRNVCSQTGLSETFDSTVGANSVFMQLGG
ncbi:MAG: phosphoribosylformylglycinamidine synthase, partial [Clostridiales bacterium]|nr:phosphoribosylformylglycinamidine synthase [Clostridiales bacterium]